MVVFMRIRIQYPKHWYIMYLTRADGSIHANPDPVSETLLFHVFASRAIMVVSMRIRIPYPKYWDFLHLLRAQ
jgi:hypothetical protein